MLIKMKPKGSFLKSLVMFFSWLILILLFTKPGDAQEKEVASYPSRPITYFISMPPGNSSDLAARLIAKEAEKYLKQPIVPVNKPGGSLTFGVAATATAKPDGYTIGIGIHSPLFLVPHLEKVPYHPIKDLKQIMQFASFNFGVIVKHDSPFKDFKDVITYARQNPKKLTFGASPLAIAHFVMEQIAKKEKVQFTQIPFKGGKESEMALLGGHILVAAGDVSYALIEAGQTRLLLLLKEELSAEYPKTPILKDLGYDVPCPMFMGVQGPKDIPEGIVKKIEEAFTLAMKEQSFINGMEKLHIPIVYRNSKELGDYVLTNYEAYGRLLKEMGVIK